MLKKNGMVVLYLLWTAGAGYLDFMTGPDVSMLVLYAVPVLLAAKYSGKAEGLVVAVTASFCWLIGSYAHIKNAAEVSELLWNACNRLGIFAFIAYSVSLRVQLQRALHREHLRATTDYLTGLLNKSAFRKHVEEELLRARRYQHQLTLSFIDLDNFKEVNDLQGHARGDVLLQQVSSTLQHAIRKTDIAGRLGGDEFAICYPETGAEHAEQATQNLLQALEIMTAQSGWQVTASVGVVTCSSYHCSYDELLGKADKLMYIAKNKGKNRAEFSVV